jgi:hypothetical protein
MMHSVISPALDTRLGILGFCSEGWCFHPHCQHFSEAGFSRDKRGSNLFRFGRAVVGPQLVVSDLLDKDSNFSV